MRSVYKYAIPFGRSPTTLHLPENAKIVHAGEQEGTVVLWVEGRYDTTYIDSTLYVRQFQIFGTGHEIPRNSVDKNITETRYQHRGTVQMADGLVWHVYEIMVTPYAGPR